MAEIVRTRYMTTKQAFSRRDPGEPTTSTTEEVTVRSVRSDRLDVSALKDLVAALEAAGVPDKATVEAEKSSTGHLVQLRVVRAQVPLPEAGPDPDHACAAHDDAHLGQPCPGDDWVPGGTAPKPPGEHFNCAHDPKANYLGPLDTMICAPIPDGDPR